MAPVYRWKLTDGNGTERWAKPVWKDDLALEYKHEGNEQFLRAQLNGKIDFIRDDYMWIMSKVTASFGTVFHVFIEKSNDNGTNWDAYWHGRFTITDCTVTEHDKKISVQPEVVDRYNDVLDGMEKEYDLIKLTPVIESLVVHKRPMIQIYTSGEDIVNCIVGQDGFEQDASIPSDVSEPDWMTRHCHFFVVDGVTEINFENGGIGFTQPFSGRLQNGNYLTNSEGMFQIQYYEQTSYYVAPSPLGNTDMIVWTAENGLKITQVGGSGVIWQFVQSNISTEGRPVFKGIPVEIEFEYVGGGGTTLKAVSHSTNVYMRLVTNCQVYEDGPTFDIPTDDITGYNRNYLHCVPYERYNNEIIQSSAYSTTPTEWGRRDDGNYFVKPYDNAVPVGRSNWINTSIWFVPGSEVQNAENAATDAYLLQDAFPLWSVISVLLAQFSTVTFDGTTAYSQFLYSGSDPIGGRDYAMYLTPKSNITAGEYQKPAMKAPVTLRKILTMLKNTLQLYWHIDDDGRLRIEHVQYYRNGQSYSTAPSVGIDLTAMGVVRNGKMWSYDTAEYTFDKVEMPQRYVFKWMDEVTLPFKGNPIVVDSQYVQKDNEEEVSVGEFTSDIDYLLLNGNNVSQDGFAVMTTEAATFINGTFEKDANNPDTWAAPIGSAFRGRTVSAFLRIYGSGTATLVWWKGQEREVTGQTFNLYYEGTVSLLIPDDATGMAFTGAGISAGGAEIRLTVTDRQMKQIPVAWFSAAQMYGRIQNYHLAFMRMQDPYWMYDMPSKDVSVNGMAVTAQGVMRKKKQTVQIPVGDDDPDVLELVKTTIGDGTIEKMEVKLSSRMAKTTLKYDTEQ